MKRDMDLLRNILLGVEASNTPPQEVVELAIPGYSQQEVSYQVELAEEAGLLVALDLSHMGPDGYHYVPKRLTWAGHEYLEAIRDPAIWEETKAGAKKVGNFSLDLLAALAKGLVRKKVSDYTGIDIVF